MPSDVLRVADGPHFAKSQELIRGAAAGLSCGLLAETPLSQVRVPLPELVLATTMCSRVARGMLSSGLDGRDSPRSSIPQDLVWSFMVFHSRGLSPLFSLKQSVVIQLPVLFSYRILIPRVEEPRRPLQKISSALVAATANVLAVARTGRISRSSSSCPYRRTLVLPHPLPELQLDVFGGCCGWMSSPRAPHDRTPHISS